MTMTPAAVQSMLSQLRTRGFACVSLLNNNNDPNSNNNPNSNHNSIINQSGRSNKNDNNWIYDALRCATRRDAASMNEFRFPPTTEGRPIVYSDSKREAFRALFEVATTCFEGLLTVSAAAADVTADADVTATSKRNGGVEDNSSAQQHHDDDGGGAIESRRMFAKALHRVRDRKAHQLFHGNENEPFQQQQSGQHPFSQSFFNLFNYDHGSLNGHVDRSLLTVIYSCSYSSMMPELANGEDDEGGTMHRSSALWVKDPFGKWHNADRTVEPHQAIVMVGEDLERSGIAEELGLFAAEHAVRVDPEGERIAHSHFRRDPACSDNCGDAGGIEGIQGGSGVGNRLSAAMILRHEPE